MKKGFSFQDVQNLARRQLRDYRAKNPGTCFSEPDFSMDVRTAYDLQDAVSKLRIEAGERIIGYKIGCIGPETATQFGMDGPIRGTLFAGEILEDRTFINPNQFSNLAIEGEMAVRINERYEIEAAFPVIELHNFVFRSPKKTLSELIANNGINAGLVVPIAQWQRSQKYIAKKANLAVNINGKNLASANLWPTKAGPEWSVNWLQSHLHEYGLELLPGSVILVGTPLGLYPVEDGDEIIVVIDDQPLVSCFIEAPAS
ncbi:MAG: hypothetical protein CBB68_00505 [Rhodospirillaceae bacterium TMED8]|nr:hypothetical protein [Magnetovibrio sp.]OUT53366.1 MAG: hypothetical protein CBB68_00505 [Rhodospirillaceae bacterium TMED8]|tara:strand:+ start:770 stop:1543 length:774 start_codon:yes stop_codon:yes gene_type:complete